MLSESLRLIICKFCILEIKDIFFTVLFHTVCSRFTILFTHSIINRNSAIYLKTHHRGRSFIYSLGFSSPHPVPFDIHRDAQGLWTLETPTE